MKKKVIIMKNEKKNWCRKCGLGYCPTVLQGLEVLYCEKKKKKLYCEIVLQGRLENSGKLYCNTPECIAIEATGLA